MSRFVAVAAAVALVVSGIMIGALGTYLVLDRPHAPAMFPPPMPRPDGPPGPGPGPQGPPPVAPFPPEGWSRLDLSDEQRDQIDAILFESRHEADVIRRELRPKLEAHLDATRQKIKGVLTPKQQEAFEKLVREDRRRVDRFFIEGPGPGRRPGPPPR